MLGIASYTDVKKREVSDFLWVGFGIIAVALIFLEPNFEDSLLSIGISLIVAPFVLLIWRFGLFGGADAFAVIVLAVLAPQITLTNNVVTPFTVLTNTVLLSIIPMFVNLIRNLMQLGMKNNIFEGFVESKSRRILAMFVGYKAKNPKYSFSIERKAGKKKKLNLSLQHAEYAQFCNTPNTWVTPGVPYMLFIAGGFIIQLIYGDIIFNILGLRP
jgi:preflagellin peptidase FlaK